MCYCGVTVHSEGILMVSRLSICKMSVTINTVLHLLLCTGYVTTIQYLQIAEHNVNDQQTAFRHCLHCDVGCNRMRTYTYICIATGIICSTQDFGEMHFVWNYRGNALQKNKN